MSLRDYLSHLGVASSKRLIGFNSSNALIAGFLAITFGIVFQACKHWEIDGALVTAFGLAVAAVAGLAGVIYRKPEDKGEPKP